MPKRKQEEQQQQQQEEDHPPSAAPPPGASPRAAPCAACRKADRRRDRRRDFGLPETAAACLNKEAEVVGLRAAVHQAAEQQLLAVRRRAEAAERRRWGVKAAARGGKLPAADSLQSPWASALSATPAESMSTRFSQSHAEAPAGAGSTKPRQHHRLHLQLSRAESCPLPRAAPEQQQRQGRPFGGRSVPPEVAAVLEGGRLEVTGVTLTTRVLQAPGASCSVTIVSGLHATSAEDMVAWIARLKASPLAADHIIQVRVHPCCLLGWKLLVLAGLQDRAPAPVVVGVARALPSFATGRRGDPFKAFARSIEGDTRALAALTDFSGVPLLAFDADCTLDALQGLSLSSIGLVWSPHNPTPPGLAAAAARMHALCPFTDAQRKGSGSRGPQSGMISGGYRHACSGPHPGRVTEYSRKSARPEQITAYYAAARAVAGAVLQTADAALGAPMVARLSWPTGHGAHPQLASLALGPGLPFQQIHSTRAAPGVAAHVDRSDMAGCVIGWAEVTPSLVEAAEREAAALRPGQGAAKVAQQQQQRQRRRRQQGQQQQVQSGPPSQPSGCDRPPALSGPPSSEDAGEAMGHFVVWPYGIRLDVGHGSALTMRSDTLLHGTAPVVLPDGRPSGCSGGGGGGGAGASSNDGEDGAGGGQGSIGSPAGGMAGGSGRQLVGVALVCKLDVTCAAINQVCDREITWLGLP